MSEKLYYTGIDLQHNNLKNAVIHPSATDPLSPVEGQIYYNTTTNMVYVYSGSAWDEVGVAPLTIATDSSSFLSIVNGELHFSNVAITEVHVDTTHSTLATFIAASYTVGNEYHEGDVIILTTATDQGQRTWIHNGGTAANANDFTALTSTVSTSVIREALSGGDGIAYDSTTGDIDVDHDSSLAIVGGQLTVNQTVVTPAVLGQITASNGVAYNSTTHAISADVDDVSMTIGTDGLEIKDGGVGEAKLASDVVAKLNTGFAQSVGDGTATSFTITHGLNSKDVMVNIYKVDTGECVTCNVARTTVNAISVGAFPAPATNNLRILVQRVNL